MTSVKSMSVADLLRLEANVYAVLNGTGGSDYGIDHLDVVAMNSIAGATLAAANNQKSCEIAAKTATAVKDAEKSQLSAALGAIQTSVKANPAVSNEMIVALGFSPRRGSVRSRAWSRR